ncbi:hypothetical protein BU012_04725 [Mammaliicoccus sciuri]|nr:hypothetical protein BU012_04725 [Mammaliicoccus sciuri]
MQSELLTLISFIITVLMALVPIILKIKAVIINSNSPITKLRPSDYIRIIAVLIFVICIAIISYGFISIFFVYGKGYDDIISIPILISSVIPLFISGCIGLILLSLNLKYSAEIYIYNKLIKDQYELYMVRYNDKIKEQEHLNMIRDLDEPKHNFLSIIEEFKEKPVKKPKIVIVYNCLFYLFILLWGISIIPTWILYNDQYFVTRILLILIMFIPVILIAYKFVSFQNGKLYLTEYEIKQHVKRYKRQHKKNNRTKKHVRTYTVLNYEITFNKLGKGRQTDEK